MVSIIRTVFTACVFLFGLLFILKISAARIIAPSNPEKSLELFPGYSSALLEQNKSILTQGLNEQAKSQAILLNSEKALLGMPLSDTPLVHIGLSELLVDSKSARPELFEFAKHRNIHNRSAILSLINIGVNTNNASLIIDNLHTLTKLGTKGSEEVLQHYAAIASIAAIPGGQKAVDELLRERPKWAYYVLSSQISTMAIKDIPKITQSISEYSNSTQALNEDKHLHEVFMTKLIQLQAYEQAQDYWKSYLPKPDQAMGDLIYNRTFQNSEALAPFNWQTVNAAKYYSEFGKEGGLFVSYNDSVARGVVFQIFTLKPGARYKFSTNAKWNYKSQQGKFVWQIQCLPAIKGIAELSLEAAQPSSENLTMEFRVPTEACEAQRLQLLGRPGQYNKRIWANIDSVSLESVRP